MARVTYSRPSNESLRAANHDVRKFFVDGILIAPLSTAENKLKSRLVTGQRGIEWRIIRYSFAIFSNAQSQSRAQSVPLTPRFTTTQSAINLPLCFNAHYARFQ